MTLTFVLFVSALLSYLVIANSTDDTIFLQQLETTQRYYENYFTEQSCKNLHDLATIIHSGSVNNPECFP